MVLQRWQTVYLLIAAIAMAIAAFVPAVKAVDSNFALDYCAGLPLVFRIVCGFTALFFLATISKFKNLKLQMQLCSMGAMLSLAAFVVVALDFYLSDIALRLLLPAFLPGFALICAFLAKSRIVSDYKLIHDSERIR